MSINSVSSVQFEGRKNPDKVKNKGVGRTLLAYGLIKTGASLTTVPIMPFMKKVSLLTPEQVAQLDATATKGLQKTGLWDKGVRILKVHEENIAKFFNPEIMLKGAAKKLSASDVAVNRALLEGVNSSKLIQFLSKHKSTKEFARYMKKGQVSFYSLLLKIGENAFFMCPPNKIFIPDKHLQTSVFHEMGHAMNNNLNKGLKALQHLRPMGKFLPIAVLLTALFNKRKTTDAQQQNDSKMQRGADFVKRNAGKLSALAMLPTALEEGIASLRGQKLAKQFVKDGSLSKEIFKKIKLTNLAGFTSYAMVMLITGLVAKKAVEIKDNIQAKYEKKVAERSV